MADPGHRLYLRLALLAAALLVSMPLVAGFLGGFHPAFDSFSHFRAHLAAILAVCAIAMLATRGWVEGVLALAFASGAFLTTQPRLTDLVLPSVHAAIQPTSGDRATYRLIQLNLYYENWDPGAVLSMIGREKPDVVTLNEVSPEWAGRLELLRSAYPYSIVCPVTKTIGGVAVLSRRPFAEGRDPQCFDRGSMAVVPVDFGGRIVEIVALHLGWPWPFGQNWQVGNVSPILARVEGPALLAGDLNSAPWSRTARRIAAAGNFAQLPVVGISWLHRAFPDWLRFAGLPIDQAMAKGVDIHTARTIAPVGSDHLPILVEFSLPPQEPGEPETVTALSR